MPGKQINAYMCEHIFFVVSPRKHPWALSIVVILGPINTVAHFLYTQVTFLDLIILPLWETWAELVYPDAQDMLDNLSKTREYWHDQIKCTSPLLSENEREGEDPGSVGDNEHPVEGESSSVVTEESSMNRSEKDLHTCPEETDSLQNSSDSLKFIESPANQRR